MTLENLTQLQKIAIEGEVAGALSTAKHNAEILYRIYVMLKNAPKEITEYIIEAVRNVTSLDETLIDKVILEVSANTVPVWLWIDRIVADIKLSITLAEADGMICKADLDKKLVQKKVVKSAFVSLCRNAAIISPESAIQLCKHIIDEESLTLDFLEDACFALIEEIRELPSKDTVPDEIIHKNFDIRNTLSYKIETQVLDALNKQENKEVKKRKVQKKLKADFEKILDDDEITVYAAKLPELGDGFLADAVSHAITQVLNDQLKTDKAKKAEALERQYAVVKEYDGSDISSTLKVCKTEEEAEAFKDKLEKQYPELMKTCKIKVVRVR